MPNYKDTNNTLHCLSESDITNGGLLLLPAGCVEVTEEEAIALQPVQPNPRIAEIKSALADLDFKKIRPLSSGDTQYLATLNAQTATLQTELKGLTQ